MKRSIASRSSRDIAILIIIIIILLLMPGASFAQTPLPAARAPTVQLTPTIDVVPGNKPAEIYYTVQRGDSLWLIAQRFGVTVDLIAKTNGFNGKKVLREGMRLYLPYSIAPPMASVSGRILSAPLSLTGV